MQETFELTAEVRTDKGKGASRRLRRMNMLPAIIYGGNKEPQPISLPHNELMLHLQHEAFYSHILTINLQGKAEKAVLRDLHRHPSKPIILHADFLRVKENEELRMHVPLHFLNEDTAVGVKQQGGIVSHLSTDVEVSCLAKDLPEYIEVDLANLAVGESIHLSELKLPAGVTLVELMHGPEHDQPVVSMHKPRGGGEAEAEPGEEAGGEEKSE